MSEAVARLRSLIEQQFPDALPPAHRTAEQVATGIAPLDAILPGGGFPRGKLSVWEPLGGAGAILRAACAAAVRQGERSAWLDGARAVAGSYWVEGPLLLQPKSRRDGLRAAEEVLRCGGFALLVLAGLDPQGTEMVRLTRAAREGGTALVALTERSSLSSVRLSSRINPHGYRWRRTPFGEPAEARAARVQVRARSLGWNASTELTVPIMSHELRLSLEPHLADRRGVSR